jgi:hypothetical protein
METVTPEGLAEYKAYVRAIQEAYNASLDPPAPPWANYLMRRWKESVHPSRSDALAWRVIRKAWNVSVEHPRRVLTYQRTLAMLYRLRQPTFRGLWIIDGDRPGSP